MVKKAKLDILEAQLDEKSEDVTQDDFPLEQGQVDRQTAGHFMEMIRSWVHAYPLRVVLLSFALFGLIVGSYVMFYYGMAVKSSATRDKSPLSENSNPEMERMAFLGGMVIDQKDERGNIRIAFCNIALDLEKPQAANTIANRIDVRDAVYSILKRKKVEDGLSTGGRDLLKLELKNDLNRLLGDNLIKNVYITSYEVN